VTPHQTHLAKQASKAMDPGKLKHLITELCHSFDSEREENRQLRRGCLEDCTEYEWTPLEATPDWVININLEVPLPPVPLAL